jgi:hypothetical protein
MENETEQKVEQYYLNEANRFVDVIFGSKLFREDITRTQMSLLAEVVGFYLQSYAKSAQRTAEFVLKAKEFKK